MELNPKQQTTELIKNSQRILLLTHLNADGDALGSLLALFLVLKKLGKDVTAVAPDPAPQVFKFLPQLDQVRNDFAGSKDFIVSFDCSRVQVDHLGYKNLPEENKLNIIISPKEGTFSPEDVAFSYGALKYDLIFILDSPDLERLGPFYDKETELFYETPIINIDHHPANDYFGRVNWIELTATSTAEILVSLLESLGREKNLINPDIATCLLTGIITDTGSFQNSNTTPKSFTVAAQLIAAGARQQDIIRHVYKTKPLTTLRLWGKILSNIKEDRKHRFIWSGISKRVLVEEGASEEETSGIIDELLKAVPGIDFALLLAERKNGVHGSLRGINKGVNVLEVARLFNGGGHELAAAFHLPNVSLEEVEEEIINKIREMRARNLSLQNLDRYQDQFPKNQIEEDVKQISERFSST